MRREEVLRGVCGVRSGEVKWGEVRSRNGALYRVGLDSPKPLLSPSNSTMSVWGLRSGGCNPTLDLG